MSVWKRERYFAWMEWKGNFESDALYFDHLRSPSWVNCDLWALFLSFEPSHISLSDIRRLV